MPRTRSRYYSTPILQQSQRHGPQTRLVARVDPPPPTATADSSPSPLAQIAGRAKTVAVLGIKPESKASQPAHFVPEFLKSTGIDIIPVPVFFPEVTEILGKPVVRDLKAIKRQIDILDVFRRGEDLPQHLDDILAMDPRPDVVWLQSGISNPDFEMKLAEEGITVVPSRCLKVDRGSAGARAKF